ncbi:MAG: type IV pilin-like G/H family protein [Rivularia sp. (in: cyanobacteria)]
MVGLSVLYRAVSDNTSLPENIKVVKLEETVKKQANKARQSEGKFNIGAMNRAHQAYFLENNKFGTNINELQLGIKSETENYVYKVVPQSNQTLSSCIS